jgi:hypothetical protein
MVGYAPTTYQDERSHIKLNGTVYVADTEGIPVGNQLATKGGTSKEVRKEVIKYSEPLSIKNLKPSSLQ